MQLHLCYKGLIFVKKRTYKIKEPTFTVIAYLQKEMKKGERLHANK